MKQLLYKGFWIISNVLVSTSLLLISKTTLLVILAQLESQDEKDIPECLTEGICTKYDLSMSTVPKMTWQLSLYTILIFPEILTIIICTFESMEIFWKFTEKIRRNIWAVLPEIVFQTFHVIGVSILMFEVFPHFTSVKILLVANCCIFVPTVGRILYTLQTKESIKLTVHVVLDILGSLVILGAIVLVSISESASLESPWLLPVGIILTSFSWWRTLYFQTKKKKIRIDLKKVDTVLDITEDDRNLISLISSTWKLIVYSLTFLTILKLNGDLPQTSNTLKPSFSSEIFVKLKPSSPPAVHLNESARECLGLPYIAAISSSYPVENDCSAFWVRKCGDSADLPNLRYVLCPNNMTFTGENRCYGTSAGCCQPTANCGNRTHFDCLNPNTTLTNLTEYDFPDENFEDWEILLESIQVGTVYPALVLFIQILSTFLAYKSIALGCKSKVKLGNIELALGVPVFLSIVLSVVILALICLQIYDNQCFLRSILPGLKVGCGKSLVDDLLSVKAIFYMFVILFELWLTRHVWLQNTLVLARTETLFSYHYYNSLFIDQSLFLIRRKYQKDGEAVSLSFPQEITIQACATMWHESKQEMENLLQSVKRVIEDNANNPYNSSGVKINWETYVIFDDAFDENGLRNVNVQNFIQKMKEIFYEKYDQKTSKESPFFTKYATPFGSQLRWDIPIKMGSKISSVKDSNDPMQTGCSLFVCFLKDKKKIKNKKRWSQCMYFAYFLKDVLYEGGEERLHEEKGERIKEGRWGRIKEGKEKIMKKGKEDIINEKENHFVLALDGDVIFNYNSVTPLVDFILKDRKIGAVCGQILPVGKGFLKFYQLFEYYLGHWLQKSTESILGNVLCSPGCFSLIRMSALYRTSNMDSKYALNEAHNESKNKVNQVNYMPIKNHGDSKTKIKEVDMVSQYKKELKKSILQRYMTIPTEPMHYVQYDQGEDRWLCTLLIERGWKIQYSALSHCKTACPESFDEFFNQRRRWSPSTVANIWDLLRNGGRILLKEGHLSLLHLGYQLLAISSSAIGPGSVFLMLVGGAKIAFGISLWGALATNSILLIGYLIVSLFDSTRKHQTLAAKILSLIYGLLMMVILISMFIEYKRGYNQCPLPPSILSLFITTGSFLVVAFLHIKIKKWPRYLLSALIFYISIPAMFLVLPFYCVVNIDNVSWGTREKSSSKDEVPNKKKFFRRYVRAIIIAQNFIKTCIHKPSIENKNSSTVRLDGFICAIAKLAEKDTDFWNFMLGESNHKNYRSFLEAKLKPVNTDKDTILEKEKALKSMRTEIFLFFLFVNAGWSLGIFFMQKAFEDDGTFGIDWKICELPSKSDGLDVTFAPLNSTLRSQEHEVAYYKLDPINVVFLVLFLGILSIQILGMLLHRIRNLGHKMADASRRPKRSNTQRHRL